MCHGRAAGRFASQRAASHLAQEDVARRWARKKDGPGGGKIDALGQHLDTYEYLLIVAFFEPFQDFSTVFRAGSV